jgi:cell division topological specificity factor
MNFLRRIFGKSDIGYSAREAKTRLTSAIAQDRSGFSPEALDMIKRSVVEAVSKHMDVDNEHVQLSIAREGQTHNVVANIPIVNTRRARAKPPRLSTARRGTRTIRTVRTVNSKG